MKNFLKRHRIAALLLPALLLGFLWYSRPVDIYTLLGKQEVGVLHAVLHSYEDSFPSGEARHLLLEDAQTEQILGSLEELRFIRSPLGALLQRFSPRDPGGHSTNWWQLTCFQAPEDQSGGWLQFDKGRWSYGLAPQLPLFVLHGKEAGWELGELLWELAEKAESVS